MTQKTARAPKEHLTIPEVSVHPPKRRKLYDLQVRLHHAYEALIQQPHDHAVLLRAAHLHERLAHLLLTEAFDEESPEIQYTYYAILYHNIDCCGEPEYQVSDGFALTRQKVAEPDPALLQLPESVEFVRFCKVGKLRRFIDGHWHTTYTKDLFEGPRYSVSAHASILDAEGRWVGGEPEPEEEDAE